MFFSLQNLFKETKMLQKWRKIALLLSVSAFSSVTFCLWQNLLQDTATLCSSTSITQTSYRSLKCTSSNNNNNDDDDDCGNSAITLWDLTSKVQSYFNYNLCFIDCTIFASFGHAGADECSLLYSKTGHFVILILLGAALQKYRNNKW